MGRLPCIWLVWRVCDVGERNTRPQSASSLAQQSADGYSTRTHWKQQGRRGKTFGKMWVFQRKSSEDVVSIEEIITILFLFYLFASSEDFRWKTHVFPNVFPIFRRKTHVFPNVRHASATKRMPPHVWRMEGCPHGCGGRALQFWRHLCHVEETCGCESISSGCVETGPEAVGGQCI